MRPIIDAHHHLWELGRFPYRWLGPNSPPRPFGDHSGLKRDYRISDYRADLRHLNVIGSVFVEANAGAHGAAEIAWVDEEAEDSPFPAVVVGSLDLRKPDVEVILQEFLKSPRMRGIRMSLCWDRRPQWRFIDRADVMQSAEFRAGLTCLTRRGLVLDALVMPGQLTELAQLAAENPDQVIVVNHLGTPDFETAADRKDWEDGMRACGRRSNILVKISGLWPLDREWRPKLIGPAVRFVVDQFGPARCMWASNLPVEKLMCPADTQIAHLSEALGDLSEDEMDRIFRRTALSVYRMEECFAVSGAEAVGGAAGPGTGRPGERDAGFIGQR